MSVEANRLSGESGSRLSEGGGRREKPGRDKVGFRLAEDSLSSEALLPPSADKSNRVESSLADTETGPPLPGNNESYQQRGDTHLGKDSVACPNGGGTVGVAPNCTADFFEPVDV